MLIPPPPRPKNEREIYMLKSYEEVKCDRPGQGASMEEGLWNIARELSRKNDLLELGMLCTHIDVYPASALVNMNGEIDGHRIIEIEPLGNGYIAVKTIGWGRQNK